jgi:molybdopterin-binding protein
MPKQHLLSASDAARRLGISLDTLRRWDRCGRITTKRDAANRRLVPLKEVERLLGAHAGEPAEVSARNRFRGIVRSVELDGLLARVELQAGPFRVVSIVTREAVEELEIEPGQEATALVKATSVILER